MSPSAYCRFSRTANLSLPPASQSTRRIETMQGTIQKDLEGLSTNIHDQSYHMKKERILSWICPVLQGQERKALQDMVGRRHPGTCQWIIQSASYTRWIASPNINLCWITALGEFTRHQSLRLEGQSSNG